MKIKIEVVVPSDGLVVCVEPWADEFAFKESGSLVSIEFEGPLGGNVETKAVDERFTVFGWEGSSYVVTHNGVPVG